MFHQKFSLAFIAFIGALLPASAQITIDGIADRANYNNTVSYRVQTQVGFTDAAFLNGLSVPVGVFNTISHNVWPATSTGARVNPTAPSEPGCAPISATTSSV